MSSKKQYRVHNWSNYNKSLIDRGRITLWFNEKAIKSWYTKSLTGKRGASDTYSDLAITTCLMIRAVFNLPLRATQGYIDSLFILMGVSLKCPDYSRLSRRGQTLDVLLPFNRSQNGIDIVVDSSGLKIYGEGEWKVRTHGASKRRTWRKMHLGIDLKDQKIIAAALSTNDVADAEAFPALLEQVGEDIDFVAADGAYDSDRCYQPIAARGAQAIIPPRKNAKINDKADGPGIRLRNQNIKEINDIGQGEWAKELWKDRRHYHRRSLAETAMYRFKTIFGGSLRSRTFENQTVELFIKIAALNKMTEIGMPESYQVA